MCGALLSLPLIVFFGIGAQTFIRSGEKKLAVAVLWFGLGLLGLSVATLFRPGLTIAALAGAVVATGIYLALWLYSKRRHRR